MPTPSSMSARVPARPREGAPVLGSFIDAVSWDDAVGRLVQWGERRESRYVCICNVHSVVTATQDAAFRTVLDEADMATPDGAPVAWALRRAGFAGQERINGPDLMWRYLAEAERRGQVVFFYGGTEDTLAKLQASLLRAFPGCGSEDSSRRRSGRCRPRKTRHTRGRSTPPARRCCSWASGAPSRRSGWLPTAAASRR